MADRYGPRGVFAVMIPLQNANMQPEYQMMKPEGVSNQIYRFDLSRHDEADQAMVSAIPGALGCWPDKIICGNSIEMRLWSREQHKDYMASLQEAAGEVPVITATEATSIALKSIGAKRIGVLSPMSEEYSRSVQEFYGSLGFEVPYATWLKVEKPEYIINAGAKEARDAFQEIAYDDVDTFLHVGGALGIVDVIEELEQSLERPIVSVNIAAYWYSLRRHGIRDPLAGFGKLAQLTDITDSDSGI